MAHTLFLVDSRNRIENDNVYFVIAMLHKNQLVFVVVGGFDFQFLSSFNIGTFPL